jgi:hypothetical protein
MKKGPRFSSYLRRLFDRLKRLFGRKPDPEPDDPYAYSMAPLRRPPRGKSGAAVADVEEEE